MYKYTGDKKIYFLADFVFVAVFLTGAFFATTFLAVVFLTTAFFIGAFLGDGFGAKNLVAANAIFIIAYESGAVVGPAFSGSAMDVWPDNGFVGFLLICAVLFAGMAVKKARQSSA